jgi:hypothetical protein
LVPAREMFNLMITIKFMDTSNKIVNGQKVNNLGKNILTCVHPGKYRKKAKSAEIV